MLWWVGKLQTDNVSFKIKGILSVGNMYVVKRKPCAPLRTEVTSPRFPSWVQPWV